MVMLGVPSCSSDWTVRIRRGGYDKFAGEWLRQGPRIETVYDATAD